MRPRNAAIAGRARSGASFCAAWSRSAGCARSSGRGSLLTGQLYVAFDYYPAAPKAKVDLRQAEPELPVVPGTLANLEDEARRHPRQDRQDAARGDRQRLKKDLDNLDQTLKDARKLINNADAQLVPGLKTAIDDLHSTLVAVERATTNANATLLGPECSPRSRICATRCRNSRGPRAACAC